MQRVFPFSWLRPGQNAIQVGCAEWLLDFGVSQALVMSALVGPKGHVLVIEPDRGNVERLEVYLRRHRISNISIVEKGAWNSKDVKTLTFYDDRSSSNVISEIRSRDLDAEFMSSDSLRPTHEKRIEVDTIDNIVQDLGYSPDFINMTINGAEYEAIQGLQKTLQSDVVLAFPIWGPRDWFQSSFDLLQDHGYDVVVCDAPYTNRAPSVGGLTRFWKPRTVPQHLYACGIKAARRNLLGGREEYEVQLKRSPKNENFEIIPAHREI